MLKPGRACFSRMSGYTDPSCNRNRTFLKMRSLLYFALCSLVQLGSAYAQVSPTQKVGRVWSFRADDLKEDLDRLAIPEDCENRLNIDSNEPTSYLDYDGFKLHVFCTKKSKKTLKTRLGINETLLPTEIGLGFKFFYKNENRMKSLVDEFIRLGESTEQFKFGKGGIAKYSAGIYKDVSENLKARLGTIAELHLRSRNSDKVVDGWSSRIFHIKVNDVDVQARLKGLEKVVHLGSERIFLRDKFDVVDCEDLIYNPDTKLFQCDGLVLKEWALGRFYDHATQPKENGSDDAVPLITLKKHLDEISFKINERRETHEVSQKGGIVRSYPITGAVALRKKRLLKLSSTNLECPQGLFGHLVKIEGILFGPEEDPPRNSVAIYSDGNAFYEDEECTEEIHLQELTARAYENRRDFIDFEVRYRSIEDFKEYLMIVSDLAPSCVGDPVKSVQLRTGINIYYHCVDEAFYFNNATVLKRSGLGDTKGRVFYKSIIYFKKYDIFAVEDGFLEDALGIIF